MAYEALKAALEIERAELLALSDTTKQARAPVALDQQSVGRLSRMDAMQQQSMDVAREGRRRDRLAILDAALKRLEQDDYGYCLSWGHDIALARLQIDPAVTNRHRAIQLDYTAQLVRDASWFVSLASHRNWSNFAGKPNDLMFMGLTAQF